MSICHKVLVYTNSVKFDCQFPVESVPDSNLWSVMTDYESDALHDALRWCNVSF